jgi:hypothetical protein
MSPLLLHLAWRTFYISTAGYAVAAAAARPVVRTHGANMDRHLT